MRQQPSCCRIPWLLNKMHSMSINIQAMLVVSLLHMCISNIMYNTWKARVTSTEFQSVQWYHNNHKLHLYHFLKTDMLRCTPTITNQAYIAAHYCTQQLPYIQQTEAVSVKDRLSAGSRGETTPPSHHHCKSHHQTGLISPLLVNCPA